MQMNNIYGLALRWDLQANNVKWLTLPETFRQSVGVHSLTVIANVAQTNGIRVTYADENGKPITSALGVSRIGTDEETGGGIFTREIPSAVFKTAGVKRVTLGEYIPVVKDDGSMAHKLLTTGYAQFSVGESDQGEAEDIDSGLAEILFNRTDEMVAALFPLGTGASGTIEMIADPTPHVEISITPIKEGEQDPVTGIQKYAYETAYKFHIPKGEPGPPGPSVAAGMYSYAISDGMWEQSDHNWTMTVTPEQHRMGATPNILVFFAPVKGGDYGKLYDGYTVSDDGVVTLTTNKPWGGYAYFCGGIAQGVDETARAELAAHENDKTNPHGVTAEQVGAQAAGKYLTVPEAAEVTLRAQSGVVALTSDLSGIVQPPYEAEITAGKWQPASVGGYTYTIAAATHGKGANCYAVIRNASGRLQWDSYDVAASGDVTFTSYSNQTLKVYIQTI